MLPPGIYRASLEDVLDVFGQGTDRREKAELLKSVVVAAHDYPTIKRVLIWGSFISTKPNPGDLDYSIVVEAGHSSGQIAERHRRFFVPSEARLFYGVDRGYLLVYDFPIERYAELLMFLCRDRRGEWRGIVEIPIPRE